VLAEEVFLIPKPLAGVYLIKGNTKERIIYRQGPHIAPRLSPNGEKILFHSKQGGEIGIWLTNLQGEEMGRLCDGEQAEWAPADLPVRKERTQTGGRVIFVRNGKIFLTVPKLLVEGEIRSAPKCSPDGKKIAYQDGC